MAWLDEDGHVARADDEYLDVDEAIAMAALVSLEMGTEISVEAPVGRGPHVKAIVRVTAEDLRG